MILHEGDNQLDVQMTPLVETGHITIHFKNPEKFWRTGGYLETSWSVRAFHPRYGECYSGDPPWAYQGKTRTILEDLHLDVSSVYGDPPVGCNRILITIYSLPFPDGALLGDYHFYRDWSYEVGDWEFDFETGELTQLNS